MFAVGERVGHLKLSTRSLQRRLKEEGPVYQELMDETRRGLAFKYIAEPQLTLAEITYLLGFSDQSHFGKAFRRWTGSGPQQYRQGARR